MEFWAEVPVVVLVKSEKVCSVVKLVLHIYPAIDFTFLLLFVLV
jgi:hypothetical protein